MTKETIEKMELLAPGASPEGMRSALCAGADAVYMGGPRFGARAYAQNADQGQLLEAIDTCHLYGRKLYLTVNTLLREEELKSQLYQDLLPLVRQGLDAVLVQDFGVFSFLREEFPSLNLHASTQMSVMSVDGARLLHRMGATRIVPARELSLEEIAAIRDQVDIEIECFVHGALCYSYSGRCLLSSMIGGRSGNRGRCAQPCRLPYMLMQGNQPISSREAPYLLSLKDIRTLPLLPRLKEAGVCSLKIEGRMKRPEYAAGVVSVYRKYVDLTQQGKAYQVDPEDERLLMDLYNRGGFSEGYYQRRNGVSMMSMERPNHAGTQAGIVRNRKGTWQMQAREELYPGDVLETDQIQWTLGTGLKMGEYCDLPGRDTKEGRPHFSQGQMIRRTHCEQLLRRMEEAYLKGLPKIPVGGSFFAVAGEPMRLCLETEGGRICLEGAMPQPAQTRESTPQEIRRQLEKSGDTPFLIQLEQLKADPGLFLRVGDLNSLRRQAASALQDEILSHWRRQIPDGSMQRETPRGDDQLSDSIKASESAVFRPSVSVLAQRAAQVRAVLQEGSVGAIYLDSMTIETGDALRQLVDEIHGAGKEALLLLPAIWRRDTRETFFRLFPEEILEQMDGYLLRCLDEILPFAGRKGKRCMADAELYSWNGPARAELIRLGMTDLTLPYELSARQLKERGVMGDELVIYGDVPVMITAQCLVKNTIGCHHRAGRLALRDRKGYLLPVENRCRFCTNILYNASVLDLRPDLETIRQLKPASLRLSLGEADPARCKELVAETARLLSDRGDAGRRAEGTRSHFKRGVE